MVGLVFLASLTGAFAGKTALWFGGAGPATALLVYSAVGTLVALVAAALVAARRRAGQRAARRAEAKGTTDGPVGGAGLRTPPPLPGR